MLRILRPTAGCAVRSGTTLAIAAVGRAYARAGRWSRGGVRGLRAVRSVAAHYAAGTKRQQGPK